MKTFLSNFYENFKKIGKNGGINEHFWRFVGIFEHRKVDVFRNTSMSMSMFFSMSILPQNWCRCISMSMYS